MTYNISPSNLLNRSG